jgi:hypothetical protein
LRAICNSGWPFSLKAFQIQNFGQYFSCLKEATN